MGAHQTPGPKCCHCHKPIYMGHGGKHTDWIHNRTNREQCEPRDVLGSEPLYANPEYVHAQW